MKNLSSIQVDTLVDENDGNLEKGDISLREALAAVKQGGRITFDPSLASQDAGFGEGVIGLSDGALTVDKSLTIKGLGADNLTVSGENESSVFVIDDGNSRKNSTVVIRGLTISNGAIPSNDDTFVVGSAIESAENLSVFNSRITDSQKGISSQSEFDADQPEPEAKLLVRNSTISGNAEGIAWEQGSITIANTHITNNSDGIYTRSYESKLQVLNSKIEDNVRGIYSGSDVRIVNSSVSNNRDGIYAVGTGTVTITGSTVANNAVTTLGVFGDGSDIKVFRSAVSGEQGELISSGGQFGAPGNIDLIQSTLDGGTLNVFFGTVTVKDSVVSGSSGKGPFEGIAVFGYGVDMQRSTLINTKGVGISAYSARIKDSVIAGNRDGGIKIEAGYYGASPTLSIENSTISGNGKSSSTAGAIEFDPYSFYLASDVPYSIRFNNSIITGNTGKVAGGVLIKPSDPSGYYGGISTITIRNTTIAGNTGFDLVSDPVKSLGGNLIGKGDRTAGFTQSSDVVGRRNRPIDPPFNVIQGRNGKDRLVGTQNSDIIRGRNGSDTLIGNSGNDVLLGERGQDKLLGGAGDDILNGGEGSDQLRGGSGKDIFVYQRIQHGLDIISDFQTGQDKIDLSAILSDGRYNSNTLFEDYIHIGQSGRNSAIVSVLDIDRSSTERAVFRELTILRNVSTAAIDEGSFVL